MRFRRRAREELSQESIVERFRRVVGSLRRSGMQGTGPIQSLTTKRGGQSRRRPSLWACSNASVQSWKKWLRSLNPKSRTMRSNLSKCSRRTLVVRLPCIIWVNSGSVFILAIQRRRCNGSTTSHAKPPCHGGHLDPLQSGGTEFLRVRRVDQSICSKESILVLSARILRVMRLSRSRHYGQFRIFCLISSKVTSFFSNRCSFCFPLPIFAAHLLNVGV